MIRIIYYLMLLFILSGMFFVTRQSAEGLPLFLLKTAGMSLAVAALATIISKKKTVAFFGNAAFFLLFLIGIVQIILGVL